MSDALCGPSNPLQQFKQVSQGDRTLQQDRLVSRHSPAQGFRSHDPNAGLLDPEFEAFQAGLPAPDLPEFHQHLPRFGGPSSAPSWAADFSRMTVSSPPPFQQQYIPQAGPSTANSNWAHTFQQHVAQTAPRAQTSAQSPQQFQQMARYGGLSGFQSNFSQSTYAPTYAPTVQSKGKEAVREQFDEAAFARAFDQAREDLLADESAIETEVPILEKVAPTSMREEDVDQVRREAMEAQVPHQRPLSQDLETLHLENMSRPDVLERLDRVPLEEAMLGEENEPTEQHRQDDDDALAATAKELLEKVEHNQSDKFRNSQFLSLMRKLRDREMKVEGDHMVETAAASSATTSTHAADKTAIPLFDNSEQTPHPLAEAVQPVDTRPLDYDRIPLIEQDHDAGRIDPRDGQAVVDYLSRDPRDASPDDIGTSHHDELSEVSFYGEMRPRPPTPQQRVYKPLRQRRRPRRRDGEARSTDWTPWHAQSVVSAPEHAPFVQDLDDEYALLTRAADSNSAFASASGSGSSSGASSRGSG